MADLTARPDHWTDFLPGNWQQAINTHPILNALGRALSRQSPDMTRGIEHDQYGSVSDRNWLLEAARGGPPKLNPLAAEMLDKGGLLANFLGPGVKLPAAAPKPTGIRAYHGSPHDFDRFDISKIGTGEGNQAYGPGLYFAESEGVARSYRDTLAPEAYVRGKPVMADDLASLPEAVSNGIAWDKMMGRVKALGSVAAARQELEASPESMIRGVRRSRYERALDDMERMSLQPNTGRMYEVRINADPEQFLDWDKPLAQQPEAVKRTIEPALRSAALDLGKGATPEVLARFEGMGLKNIADRMRPKEIDPWSLDTVTLAQQYPNALREAGIPGVKYLDQGSRAAGEGSRNYVVFDDKLIEILRKYGLLPPVAAGTAAALNQQEPPL